MLRTHAMSAMLPSYPLRVNYCVFGSCMLAKLIFKLCIRMITAVIMDKCARIMPVILHSFNVYFKAEHFMKSVQKTITKMLNVQKIIRIKGKRKFGLS